MNKTVGIIGAMEVEVNTLIEQMDGYNVKSIKTLKFHTGIIHNTPVVVVQSSIGKVNATIATQMMIDHFKIDYLINTGIAGALDPQLSHLDMVISKDLVYYDVRKSQMANWFPKQPTFIADTTLVHMTQEIVASYGIKHHVGLIATGEDFVTQAEKKQWIFNEFGALCCEMEGCAIAHTAFVNQVPFIVIRSISDLANESSENDYAQFEKISAEQSARVVMALLSKIHALA